MLDRVVAHAADVAIPATPPADDRLLARPLLENEIVCITAPDDPAATERPLEAGQLSDRPWLLREPGSGTRALNEQYLADHGIEPATLVLGSNGAIKQAARAGLGISLLSRAAVEAELAAGLLQEIALRDPPATRPWYVLWSAVGPPREAVSAFAEFAARTVVNASVLP